METGAQRQDGRDRFRWRKFKEKLEDNTRAIIEKRKNIS